ncbi:MAG: Tetrathionate reductase subunit precursor [Pseudomonadota bacterium]|jgi:molybdopterin-containing oxidoreductase family iron-sulfur binding subunit
MSSLKNNGRRLWRSLAEYDNDPEFRKYLESEFGVPPTESLPSSTERRRFMQVMAASFALAGAPGCWQEDRLLPMVRRPEGTIPGVPRYFHTSMPIGDVAVPLRAKSVDGRPIKVDGHPTHPDTQGASRMYEQASVLGMYDPDRSPSPATFASKSVADKSWVDFKTFALQHFAPLRSAGGSGLFVLATASSSKTTAEMKTRFLQQYPRARWFEYEPVNRDNSRGGSKLAFGETYRAHYDLSQARVILCLDADPLASGPESLTLARGFGQGRDPDHGPVNRVYSVESSLSPTGIQADHRLALRGAQIKALAVALEAQVSQLLGIPATQAPPPAAFLKDAKVAKFVAALVKDLVAAKGKGAVLAGDQQSPETHALVHRLNQLLGNVGATVSYTKDEGNPDLRSGLSQLVKEIGQAKTLLILDGNPVYTASVDVDFAKALASVPTSIHLGLYRDETSQLCTWHLPLAHYLESWGDAKSFDGSTVLAQPLIAPLYEGMSVAELLALLTRDSVKQGRALLQRALGFTDEKAFERAIHDGVIPGSAGARVQPELGELGPVALGPAELSGLEVQNSKLEVSFLPCSKLHDGRYANNGWLQEAPEHGMKLTWDNAAFMSPKTAAALGIEDCTLIEVTTAAGASVRVPALMAPGQAPGTIKLALGYGRTDAGIVGGATNPRDWDPVEPVGVNVYKLRTLQSWDYASDVKVSPLGTKVKLATTQDKHPMEPSGRETTQERLPTIVRQDTVAGYRAHPEAIKHAVHHPPLESLWKDPVQYDGHKWGMAIDLNKCSGCNACVVACNSENNVPVVGKSQVLMGREMHWMRIDRYFEGEDPDEPDQIHAQPVMCQHCEHAPCEQVCPVGATVHSSEGLNDMAYNRCIGTRYCSNNCPYKVRRFNYFNYTKHLESPRNKTLRMVQNPEVTVRFRGVMEKCSFCVQRIQEVKIHAKNEGRAIQDQEVRSACQDVCPTQAIEFGDLNDPKSQLVKKTSANRSYHLLQELNNRPRVNYLARITNPHPDLAPAAKADAQGGGHNKSTTSSEGSSTGHGDNH